MSEVRRVGKLRHRVAVWIDQPGEPDGQGQPAIVTKFAGMRWAEVVPLSGVELWRAQQVQSQTTHRVRVRYMDALTTQHYLKFGGRRLDILNILTTDSIHAEQVLMCVERT